MMFEPDFQRRIISVIMSFIMEFSGVPSEPDVQEISVNDLNVSTISVSCLKVTWSAEEERDYSVSCTANDDDYAYADNMYFVFKGNDLCYITGLREGTEYTVTVKPVLDEDEKEGYSVKSATSDGKTETVEVIYEFPYEDGWMNAFAGEREPPDFVQNLLQVRFMALLLIRLLIQASAVMNMAIIVRHWDCFTDWTMIAIL